MITEEDIKKIKNGDCGKLMESIDFLIDSYNEDKFDLGYKSCLEDMEIHAKKIAKKLGYNKEDRESASQIISDYLTNKINNYGKTTE